MKQSPMANLMLSIDEDVLKRARVRALEWGTSVDALVREYLEGLVARDTSQSGMEPFLTLAKSIRASSGPGGRTWTREELHRRAHRLYRRRAPRRAQDALTP